MNSGTTSWSGKTWFRIILILISLGILGAVIGIAVYQGNISSNEEAASITLGNYGTVKKTKISDVSDVIEESRNKNPESAQGEGEPNLFYLDYFSFNAGSQTFVVYESLDTGSPYVHSTNSSFLKDDLTSVRSSLVNKYLDKTQINPKIISIVPDDEAPQDVAERLTNYLSNN